ncbi:MAG: hypothetical protein ACP6IT_09570, partial [Candidatus Thorarchaeota archaeon]
ERRVKGLRTEDSSFFVVVTVFLKLMPEGKRPPKCQSISHDRASSKFLQESAVPTTKCPESKGLRA